jgi:signal transduction histidine kinase
VVSSAPLLAAAQAAAAPAGASVPVWLLGLGLAGAAGALFVSRQRQQRALHLQLQQEREALRAAQALAPGHHWRTDAHHRLLAWGAAGAAASGRCALFEPGPAWQALLPSLQAQRAFAALSVHGEMAVDGSRGWRLAGVPLFDASGAFAGFAGTAEATDVTERAHLDAELAAALLAAQPGAALIAVDAGRGWQLHAANPAARALLPEAAAGQLPARLLALADEAAADATTADTGWSAQPLALAGAPARRACLLRQAAAAAAAGSDDSMGTGHESDTFSFTLSHDLRAPIRVVEGFTRIVKEDYGHHLDRVGNDHLDRVLGAAARMNLMIDALLTLARLSQQPLARQRVNLSQLAGYVVDDLRRGAPEREVQVTIEPGLTAWGDPTLLRLVLENLLGNAWKYSAKVSPAVLSLRQVAHGEGTALVVRDNGAGFDMRSAERLFGLFQRLHSASDFPGHGVGLASVRRIVRRHGGQVWAESEAGKGAAFFFTLGS